MTGVEPILEVRDLSKNFDVGGRTLHAVSHISFAVPSGYTLGVVGESGCGKSTLGKIIVGLQSATDGRVLFKGEDITRVTGRRRKELRREMQMIFQDPMSSLDPRLCTAELIAEPLHIYKICPDRASREARVRELMDLVGISKQAMYAYPHELDGGRRQRIGIARALALDPALVVCDEPVSALDVSIQAQVLNLLRELQRRKNLTYLFITHDLSVVKHISDEILVMYMGQMVEKASVQELFKTPLHPYTVGLLSAIPVPNIHHKRERVIMEGEITTPIDLKPGCHFAARCPHACQQCHREQPPLTEFRAGHYVACHRVRELHGNG